VPCLNRSKNCSSSAASGNKWNFWSLSITRGNTFRCFWDVGAGRRRIFYDAVISCRSCNRKLPCLQFFLAECAAQNTEFVLTLGTLVSVFAILCASSLYTLHCTAIQWMRVAFYPSLMFKPFNLRFKYLKSEPCITTLVPSQRSSKFTFISTICTNCFMPPKLSTPLTAHPT